LVGVAWTHSTPAGFLAGWQSSRATATGDIYEEIPEVPLHADNIRTDEL
jgi:hypothetical protein